MTPLFLLLALLPLQDDAPSGTLTLNGGAKVTRLASVRAEVHLVSPGGGEVQMSLTVGDQAAPWVPFRQVSFLDLPGADGEKSVTLRLRDKNGKESTPVTAAIRLDTTPPVLKVEAPERVAGFELPLRLESADAGGMQYTEDLASWSTWEAFSTPKTVPLSRGAGAKQVFLRVRDDAGNESVPARLQVEAQDPAAPASPDGIRSLSLALRRTVDSLELTVWVYGSGLREIQAELDQVEVLARIPFVPSWKAGIAPSSGSRRLVVKAWDGAGREHRAEAVFLEQDVAPLPQDTVDQRIYGSWRVDLLGGVVPMGVKFKSRTVLGDREIRREPLPVVRLQAAAEVLGPLYLQIAGEWSGNGELTIYSVGGEIGARFHLGYGGGMRFELRGEVGVYYSRLDVDSKAFGGFRAGTPFRIGAALGTQIEESLWIELLVDFRIARYSFNGPPVFADDKQAREVGGAVMLGLSLRF